MHRFQRAVGLGILALAAIASVTIWFELAARNTDHLKPSHSGVVLGIWHVLYTTEPPSDRILAIAVSFAVLFAAGVGLLEHRILTRSRRSNNPQAMPLAPKVVMAASRGRFAGSPSLCSFPRTTRRLASRTR
jgi:biofilm PGA synthesis N-glycosyltransferase PgaC